MSAFVVRNNFSKIFCKLRTRSYKYIHTYVFSTCCYLPPNTKLIIRNGVNANTSEKILKRQQFRPNLLRYSTATIKPYESNRKYATNWKLERLMGWSMTVLIPTAFAIDSKELEMTLSVVALLHTYWGCQSVCSDYLRSNIVGKLLPAIVRLSVVFLFLASTVGAYQLIYKDVGLINMIKKFWSIRGPDCIPPKHMQKVERKQSMFNMFFKK